MHPSRVLSFFAEERLDIAKDEGFVSRLVHGILDESFGHDFEKRGCENSFWELSQQLYGHACSGSGEHSSASIDDAIN